MVHMSRHTTNAIQRGHNHLTRDIRVGHCPRCTTQHLKHAVPGRLLRLALTGTIAHTQDYTTSPLELIGVYVTPSRSLLGLDARQTCNNTIEAVSPGWHVHEAAQLFHQALRGNPAALEFPYRPHTYDITNNDTLNTGIAACLSGPGVRTGYTSDITKHTRTVAQSANLIRQDDPKHNRPRQAGIAAHLAIHRAEHLLTTGLHLTDLTDLETELAEAADQAVHQPDQFCKNVEAALERLNTCQTVLPDAPDRDTANDALLALRDVYGAD